MAVFSVELLGSIAPGVTRPSIIPLLFPSPDFAVCHIYHLLVLLPIVRAAFFKARDKNKLNCLELFCVERGEQHAGHGFHVSNIFILVQRSANDQGAQRVVDANTVTVSQPLFGQGHSCEA